MKNQYLSELTRSIVDLKEDRAFECLDILIAEKMPPLDIIDALSSGMEGVGERFKNGEYYLSELIFSGDIFKESMEMVKPLMEASGGREYSGKVIIGTVEGDIHDIGKNIVIMLLECGGFEVVDLGVDVPSDKFVEAIRDSGAKVVGLCALLTTAFEAMINTVDGIAQAGLRDEVTIMIGGGFTSEMVREKVGADFYGKDAAEALDFVKQILSG